jgi:hypothetical protein
MDPKLIDILVWSSSGAALGTLWRALTRPETHPGKRFVQGFLGLSVGILVGGAIIQYFNLTGYLAAGAGAVCAYLSEEGLRFLQLRGAKLKEGKIDVSLKGEDD